jgi:acyl-CoA synthetase (AMP-forming)/AMP-acid ligase II
VAIGALHEGHDALLLEDGRRSEHSGELCISGPQLTPGYLDPADGDGRFFEHAGRTWYRTGDRVVRHAEQFSYLGRLDSQVQIKGLRIELAEIDNAVRGCPGVIDAVAVARPADASVELVVYYTGERQPPSALLRNLQSSLPGGAMPREFRHVAHFPLNSNKKIDRKALTAAALEPHRLNPSTSPVHAVPSAVPSTRPA